VQPRVVVLSCNELAQVIADNPFPDETNPKYLHAAFRSEEPGPRPPRELPVETAKSNAARPPDQ
jgi:hypothetical protein